MSGDCQSRLELVPLQFFSFENNPISSLSSPKLKNDASVISSNTLSPWNSNENAGVSFVLTVILPLGTFNKFIRLLINGSSSVRNLSDICYTLVMTVFIF